MSELNSNKLSEHIKNAKLGQQTSFSFLLDYYWNAVFSFQLKRTGDEFQAEEITIKSFSKAFDKIDTFKEEFNFKTWLLAISKNTHIDQVRSQKNKLTKATEAQENLMVNTVLDLAPTPEDLMITKQNLAELLRHLKKLKPHYQEIIQLRYFQEMSYKEIASELDEPMGNIKVKLLRAKKLLLQNIKTTTN